MENDPKRDEISGDQIDHPIGENPQKQGESAGGQGENSEILTTQNPTILTDPHRVISDVKLVGRAVREHWPVPAAVKPRIVDRLLDIVEKETCQVMSKEGPVSLDGPADANSVAAARVLVAMTGQNQADRHHREGKKIKHKHSHSVVLPKATMFERVRERIEQLRTIELSPPDGANGHANGNGKHRRNGHGGHNGNGKHGSSTDEPQDDEPQEE